MDKQMGESGDCLRKLACRIGSYLLAVACIICAWQGASLVIGSPALPTPLETVSVFWEFLPQLAPAFLVSLYRVGAALLIATVLAVPAGLALGRLPRVDALVAPVLQILYPIPKVVLLPLLLVLMGLGDAAKITLMATTLFFQIVVSVRDAARQVPYALLLSVRSLGASRWGAMRYVVVPSVLPELFTALRVGSATAVAMLFLAESIAGSSGLGYFIVDAWAMIDYPRMFSGIVAMALMGVALYELFEAVERRVSRGRMR